LRTFAFEDEAPGTVLSKVNTILARDNSEQMFVTIFYAVIDLDTGIVEFSSAGHDDALLMLNSATTDSLHYMGPAIGLFDVANYPTQRRTLNHGDSLLLLTDGITEAFNIDGRVFGADRLIRLLNRCDRSNAKAIVETVTRDVAMFSEGAEQSDDITCIAVQFRG
jgi:adenylate cyclase